MKRFLFAALLGVMGAASSGQPTPVPTEFSSRISGKVSKPRAGREVRVFVESDYSGVWQEYSSSSSVGPDGAFEVQIHQPGFYWILAMESRGPLPRRGGCLVEVRHDREAIWHKLPRLRVSNKWGGTASASCSNRVVPLLTTAERARSSYRTRK